MKTMRRLSAMSIGVAAAWGAGLVLQAASVSALTATEKCQSAIAKSTAKYAQQRLKALQKCEDGRLKSGGAGSCPDSKAQDKIANAEAKKITSICKACGGADKECGGTAADLDPKDLGWSFCFGFEGQGASVIQSVGDIVTCVDQINQLAVDQLISFLYGITPSTENALLKCQRAIGKNVAKFFQTKSKAMQKCWDARIKGKHSNPCPDPGDGKAKPKIDAAELKKIEKINAVCAPFTPAQIGITTCPDIGTCGGITINNVNDLIACVDCVAEFKVDCIDALQVPQFASYPLECSPPSGLCPDTMEVEVGGGDLDNGWKGISHDADVPSLNLVTVTVSNCAGTQLPTCGQCDVSGPIPNTRLANNQRCEKDAARECTSDPECNVGPCVASACSGDPAVQCTTDIDCDFGVCSFYFGGPLPLSAGSVPVCVMNRLVTPISGTVDLDTGEHASVFQLESAVFVGGPVDQPCPNCEGDPTPADGIRGGTCDFGLHAGDPCDISNDGEPFGLVSFDCPPNPGLLSGKLAIKMNPLTTGTDTRTLTSASPQCRQSGYTGFKCMCDTCATPQFEPCLSDADCPGGATCGGTRCLGGTNAGSACSSGSDCPGGACGVPGEATQPNSCNSPFTCALDVGDTASVQEGKCPNGPFDTLCDKQRFLGCFTDGDCRKGKCSGSGFQCASDSDCGVGETCDIPYPDDVCVAVARNCFMDNGQIGQDVLVAGQPGPLLWSGAFAFPKLGAFFCEQPVAASSVNGTAGLPGLGRLTIPATVVLKKP